MLVMRQMDIDLREYLRQNHHKLTWKERINILFDITNALLDIHEEDAIHRDLHSGNILSSKPSNAFRISDLGFCGPVDKPPNSVYGNLPYVAPEVIVGKQTTFASDIYSIAMLMWEISSGQPPFINFVHDYDLAMKIINGMRPKVIPGTPLKYKILMEQCWNADPMERPDIDYIIKEVIEIRKICNQNENDENQMNNDASIKNHYNYYTSSSSINSLISNFSKVHIFEDLPDPRNANEGKVELRFNHILIIYN
jgi:serine/threonine protein kinase